MTISTLSCSDRRSGQVGENPIRATKPEQWANEKKTLGTAKRSSAGLGEKVRISRKGILAAALHRCERCWFQISLPRESGGARQAFRSDLRPATVLLLRLLLTPPFRFRRCRHLELDTFVCQRLFAWAPVFYSAVQYVCCSDRPSQHARSLSAGGKETRNRAENRATCV